MLWSLGLKRFIQQGSLTVIDARGIAHHFGVESAQPTVIIRLHRRSLHYKALLNPSLYLGEAYMNGTLTLEQGCVEDMVKLFSMNGQVHWQRPWQHFVKRSINWITWLFGVIPSKQSKANVAHHYDLSGELYAQFLDADKQYSCAYFINPNNSLEQAQLDKKHHIAAKLLLKPRQRVLDIGCGWGGLALYLANNFDVQVTGLTLSEQQYTVAVQRAKDMGLQNKVKFLLRDYRHEKGQYDRIVSVGMFEHVGAHHYNEFFRQVKSLLKPDGVALLHSIGRMDGPGATDAWIKKYIFPGGYVPALSEVTPAIERANLWITDVEILRLHYAYTLKAWRERFLATRPHMVELYGERFCRLWELYLIGSEYAFRNLGKMVFQIQLSNKVDLVPLTRDYMLEEEKRLQAILPV
ncbi:MAG: class I SAM-dependent methyltransferase [Alphaproteobacteria bacterium]|nr:class I SAM-dependent methyltransferase [Alphaproteobacteria bacterium]